MISAYLGRLPPWFGVYARSVARNPSIDFLYLCDDRPPALHPNMRWIPTSLDDIRSRIRTTLGLEADALTPYKLCDLRPMFGVLFAEHIEPYGYWAHADIDVIFGDLRRHILDEGASADYDVISSHPTRLNGPLTFWRNRADVNSLFLRNESYREAATSARSMTFDEQGMSATVREHAATIRTLYRPSHRHDASRGLWYWENGRVVESFSKEETGYFHFRTWKDRMHDVEGDKIFITREGFRAAPLSLYRRFRLTDRRKDTAWPA